MATGLRSAVGMGSRARGLTGSILGVHWGHGHKAPDGMLPVGATFKAGAGENLGSDTREASASSLKRATEACVGLSEASLYKNPENTCCLGLHDSTPRRQAVE